MKRVNLLRLVFTGALGAATLAAATASSQEMDQRRFEFTYVAELDVPEGTERVQMWLPYPSGNDYQEVRLVSIDSSVPTKVYQEYLYRNSMLFLSTSDPDLSRIKVEMVFRVTRKEHREEGFAELEDPFGFVDATASRWLSPDRLVPLDAFVRELAAEVTEGKKTVVDKAKAIFDYTVDTLEYDQSGTGWGRGDIYYACDKKRGNCTDFHAVFIGLARASNIAAKFQIGFPIPRERGEGEIAGYHCWSEFYVPGYGWVPVDTSEANKHPDKRDYFFGAHDPDRVEFSLGRDVKLNPQQAGPDLNFFIYPYAEIDGKPTRDVRRQFFYKDLDVATGDP